MVDINELRRKRQEVIVQMRALNDGVLERGQETAEETEKFKKFDVDIDAFTRQIDREERLIKHEADAARSQLQAHDNGNGNGKSAVLKIGDKSTQLRIGSKEYEERLSYALQGWLRAKRPDAELDPEHLEAAKTLGLDLRAKEIGIQIRSGYAQLQKEYRDMSLTAASGGYTVPVGFQDSLERALLAFGGVRQVATVIRTGAGNDLHWPTTNDTSNKGAILNEATTIGSSTDPTFSELILKAFKYSSKPILVSNELLQDSAFDLAGILGSMLGERIGRIQNDHFSTGAGTTLPKGLTVAGVVGKTAASMTTFTSDEVIDLQHSIDPAYRPQSMWMFHDTVLAFIRKLKDTTNQYLWQPGMRAGVPDLLLGQQYIINQSMSATFTTGQKLILNGMMSKYIIRDVREIRLVRLDERYADTDEVAFVAFLRTDGNLLDAGTRPVKWLALA